MRLFRSLAGIALASALAACAAVLGLPDPTLDESAGNGNTDGGHVENDGSGPADVAAGDTNLTNPDGSVKSCVGSTAWSAPTKIDLATNLPVKIYPSLSDDELTIYWTEVIPGQGRFQISRATRASVDAGFGSATVVSGQQLSYESACPLASGAEMIVTRVEATLVNGFVTRYVLDGGANVDQVGLNAGKSTFCRTLLADASVMYGHGDVSDPNDPTGASNTAVLFRATRSGAESWTSAVIYRDPDAGGGFFAPVVSRDEREMFFSPSGSSSSGHINRVLRGDASAEWGPREEVAALIAANRADAPGWLSADGCRLYFARGIVPEGGALPVFDIYMATRAPQ